MKLITIFFFFVAFFHNSNYAQVMDNTDSNIEKRIVKILSSPTSAKFFLAIRLFPENLFPESIKKDLIYNNDFQGLISVVVINLDEGVKAVNQDEISHWNISKDSLFKMCLTNTREILAKEIQIETLKVNDIVSYYIIDNSTNYFINSVLFFPDLLDEMVENKFGIIVGVPSRGVSVLYPLNTKDNLSNNLKGYYSFLSQIYASEDNPTTLNMYLYKDNEYFPIVAVYDNEDQFVGFSAPEFLSE